MIFQNKNNDIIISKLMNLIKRYDVMKNIGFTYLLNQLYLNKVIIYPTESVYGLGCDPDSEIAINTLLKIKNRSWKKGLILVAAHYKQLIKYVDDSYLNDNQKSIIFSTWPGPVTWLFPARLQTPYWITGKFASVAVRISDFEPIRRICLSFGKPIVSTSANITGCSMTRTIEEVFDQFYLYEIPFMHEQVLGLSRPSKIQDAITGKIIRE